MSDLDIRWKQRFNHYQKALAQLTEAVELYRERPMSRIERQGFIKAFEFTYEMAWNVIKDYFEYQGNTSIMGSRDAIREAFNRGMISDGENWMEMIKRRNKSAHIYDEETADNIIHDIDRSFYGLFLLLEEKLKVFANA